MTNQFMFPVVLGLLLLSYNKKKSFHEEGKVKFYVDPATNSEDPEKRRAYGLSIVPLWSDGGSIFVNLPEHLEYMPETKGIARHHDKRANVWHVSPDNAEANYAVESLTEPGIFFSVKAMAIDEHANFEVTITNHLEKILNSIRPLFCFQYNLIKGFPEMNTDNFAHTFIIMNGKPDSVAGLSVKNRMPLPVWLRLAVAKMSTTGGRKRWAALLKTGTRMRKADNFKQLKKAIQKNLEKQNLPS